MNKKLRGVIVSNKMDKTAVAEVFSLKTDPLYQKKYKTSKKYKIHDPENKLAVGEKVLIEECRPISKLKRWKIAVKTNK